jgi:toxin CptA
MVLPPAAAWIAGGAQWQRYLLLALCLLGTLVVTFFCLSQRWGPSCVLLLGLLLVSVTAAAVGLRRTASGQLRWDGEHWHWSGDRDYALSHLVCVIDLQRFLLLRIECSQGPSLWLWLQSPAMDVRWLALRRAVVAGPNTVRRVRVHSLPP